MSNKSVYLAVGINLQGEKELLGLWIAKNEGGKILAFADDRAEKPGVTGYFIAYCDGLKGFPEPIEAVYPQTQGAAIYAWCIRFAIPCAMCAGKNAKR